MLDLKLSERNRSCRARATPLASDLTLLKALTRDDCRADTAVSICLRGVSDSSILAMIWNPALLPMESRMR